MPGGWLQRYMPRQVSVDDDVLAVRIREHHRRGKWLAAEALSALLFGSHFRLRHHRRELRVLINRGCRVLLGVRQTAGLPDRFDGIKLLTPVGAPTPASP